LKRARETRDHLLFDKPTDFELTTTHAVVDGAVARLLQATVLLQHLQLIAGLNANGVRDNDERKRHKGGNQKRVTRHECLKKKRGC
jgi:hypothetical protein